MKENSERNIYRGTALDFEKTLNRLKDFKVDVWLGAHPNHNNTFQKLQILRKNARPNPFIDPQGWKDFIKECQTRFNSRAQ